MQHMTQFEETSYSLWVRTGSQEREQDGIPTPSLLSPVADLNSKFSPEQSEV